MNVTLAWQAEEIAARTDGQMNEHHSITIFHIHHILKFYRDDVAI